MWLCYILNDYESLLNTFLATLMFLYLKQVNKRLKNFIRVSTQRKIVKQIIPRKARQQVQQTGPRVVIENNINFHRDINKSSECHLQFIFSLSILQKEAASVKKERAMIRGFTVIFLLVNSSFLHVNFLKFLWLLEIF